MKLSTKTKYTLSALLVIADSQDAKCVSLNTISKTTQLSSSYLEQLFIRLKKANLINSNKGNLGGYCLVRKPEEISILDIMNAVNEKIDICGEPNKKTTNTDNNLENYVCASSSIWAELEKKVTEYFSTITLKDIMQHKCCGINITKPINPKNKELKNDTINT
jgi:Rrf2 family iron-sulfur cluster assembly transcriptional regulator